ncbi:hypothetical protein KJ966_02480 [bacterium]|nr:hypothetical protein [bacterium]
MAKKVNKRNKELRREQINTALEEFFSRGGRIKKINASDLKYSVNDSTDQQDDLSITADFSQIEAPVYTPFPKGHRLNDFE